MRIRARARKDSYSCARWCLRPSAQLLRYSQCTACPGARAFALAPHQHHLLALPALLPPAWASTMLSISTCVHVELETAVVCLRLRLDVLSTKTAPRRVPARFLSKRVVGDLPIRGWRFLPALGSLPYRPSSRGCRCLLESLASSTNATTALSELGCIRMQSTTGTGLKGTLWARYLAVEVPP